MARLLLTTALLLPQTAAAHIGHMGEVAGHDHWIAGIAIGAAAGLAIWGALKGKKDPEAAAPEEEAEELEEEPA